MVAKLLNMQNRPIRTALISVFDKSCLPELIKFLHNSGIQIIATDGTAQYIKKLGFSVTTIEEITHYPNLFEGRVKTLHPLIFGGILMNRDNNSHIEQAKTLSVPSIDLVFVDLYPFQQIIKKTTNLAEIIENIDIGGIALIRAAAKNYQNVLVVPDKIYLTELLEILNNNASTTIEHRKRFAAYAFKTTSFYDHCIFEYFNSSINIPQFRKIEDQYNILRYGENPHQKGIYFGSLEQIYDQLNGKVISYNNLLDLESAWGCVTQFELPACVIVKHTNPCGVAIRNTILEAWQSAIQSDPISAFGGIIACNKAINYETAESINQFFFEILAAPEFETEALQLLCSKKNRIILKMKTHQMSNYSFRQCFDGILWQEQDNIPIDATNWEIVTNQKVPEQILQEMIFGMQIVRYSKSNAVVICGNKMLYGIGTGQVSRIDATRLAIEKANNFSFPLNNSILASDGFFPFTDSIDYAQKVGIKYFVQPGGSIKDKEIIEFCNQHNLAMVFTKNRFFKH